MSVNIATDQKIIWQWVLEPYHLTTKGPIVWSFIASNLCASLRTEFNAELLNQ